MKHPGQLRVNVLSSLGSTLLSTLVMCVAYPVYLHFLGLEQYGLWLVLSTVLTMAQLGNFGISPALLKLVAEDFSAGDINGVYRYLTAGLLCLLATGTLVACAVLVLRTPIIGLFGIRGANAAVACQMLPYTCGLSLSVLISDALSSGIAGLGRYDLVSYSQLGSQALTVAVGVVLLTSGYGLWSLLFASSISYLLLMIWSLVLIRRLTGSSLLFRCGWDTRRLRRILSFGSWVFGASVVNTLLNPVNRVFVSRFAGIAAVPLYDISFTTCSKVRSLFESGFRSLTPELSRMSANQSVDLSRRVAVFEQRGSRALLYGGTAAYLGLFLFSGVGLEYWLGARFTPELPGVFRIVLAGTYFGLWSVQPWYTLLGFGRSYHLFLAAALLAVTNIGFVLPWRRPTLITVVIGTSLGILTSTIYLRRQSARLRRELEASC
jgi:O-antigen/teichoic acid export membrane protein